MGKGTVTQIDNADLYRAIGLNHDVLGLEIRMDYVHAMESGDCLEQLNGDLFNRC
jgi:hypothetical protein